MRELSDDQIDELIEELIELKNRDETEQIRAITANLSEEDKTELIGEMVTVFWFDRDDQTADQLTESIKQDYFLS